MDFRPGRSRHRFRSQLESKPVSSGRVAGSARVRPDGLAAWSLLMRTDSGIVGRYARPPYFARPSETSGRMPP